MLADQNEQYTRFSEGIPIGRGGSGAQVPQDLDRFLLAVYRYFETGGHQGVVARALGNLFTVGFTILFSFTLLGLVDWQGILVRCVDESTCHEVSVLGGWRWSSLWHWLVLIYLFVFTFYIVIVFFNTWNTVKEAKEIDVFYKLRLGIVSDFALRATSWSEVLTKLSEAQIEQPFCLVQDGLSAEEVNGIVLREDNFVLQFLRVANEINEQPTDHWPLQRLVRLALHSSACVWNIRLCFSTSFLDSRARLRRDLFLRGEGLGRVFRVVAVLNAVLTVPLMLFALFYFFLRDAEDMRASRVSPVQRQWTVEAHWRLRKQNEPPHRLVRRLEQASPSVEELISLCERQGNAFMFYGKKLVKFIAGSFAAIILIIAVYHEPALFHLHILSRNLVWYLGVFGGLVALTSSPASSKASLPRPLEGNEERQILSVLENVSGCLGLIPGSAGRSAFNDPSSKADFFERLTSASDFITRKLYVSRVRVLLLELLGVLASPVIFGVWLPAHAGKLGERIVARTASTENLGDWPAEHVELSGGSGSGDEDNLLQHPYLRRASTQ